jgi:hypothetical protein
MGMRIGLMEETKWMKIKVMIQFCKKGSILRGYSQTCRGYYPAKQCSLAAHYTIRIDSKPISRASCGFSIKDSYCTIL